MGGLMNPENEIAGLVSRLAGGRVLVVGDLILDEYLIGRATRLSREAPVPVLEQQHRFTRLGGAANPAHNVVALGGKAAVVGVIGQDEAGQTLLAQLDEAGIDRRGVVSDPGRPTTTKTRIVAESTLRVPQHLVRLDHLDRQPISLAIERVLGQHIAALAAQSDALLVSHYRTGVVTPGLVETVRGVARQHHALAVADAQADLRRFAGFDLVKCNRAEAEAELGRPLTDDVNFEAALGELLPRLGVARLAITRGAEGMSLLERGGAVIHAPASRVSDVYDVTGAGDTVVAVLTLALVAGMNLGTAARLANAAAGLVVRRLGNAVVTPAELAEALSGE